MVGVAARQPSPRWRRSSGRSRWDVARTPGPFPRGGRPYRPLAGGAIELAATVSHLFEPGRIETILHLLGDSRPIVGAGESTFTRGVVWYVPLAVGEGLNSP